MTSVSAEAAAEFAEPLPAHEALVLGEGGRLELDGEQLSELPHEEAVERLTALLGDPEETTAVGEACETHIMPGYAVRWQNFRVLVQTTDSPHYADDRKGHLVGWELYRREGEGATGPLPTFANGIGVGSPLPTVRAAYPEGHEELGDGVWNLWVKGEGTFGDTQFTTSSHQVGFISSGYGCGT